MLRNSSAGTLLDPAAPRLASVIGSRSSRTSSRWTGTVWVTFSVTTYFRSRARPASRPLGANVEPLLGHGHGIVSRRLTLVGVPSTALGRRVIAVTGKPLASVSEVVVPYSLRP